MEQVVALLKRVPAALLADAVEAEKIVLNSPRSQRLPSTNLHANANRNRNHNPITLQPYNLRSQTRSPPEEVAAREAQISLTTLDALAVGEMPPTPSPRGTVVTSHSPGSGPRMPTTPELKAMTSSPLKSSPGAMKRSGSSSPPGLTSVFEQDFEPMGLTDSLTWNVPSPRGGPSSSRSRSNSYNSHPELYGHSPSGDGDSPRGAGDVSKFMSRLKRPVVIGRSSIHGDNIVQDDLSPQSKSY